MLNILALLFFQKGILLDTILYKWIGFFDIKFRGIFLKQKCLILYEENSMQGFHLLVYSGIFRLQ